jgi:putative two-component system response regulator
MSESKKQILFVDDERFVLDSLRRMLRSRRSDWEMTYIDRPEEAWDRLQEKDFDAVVTDLKMPGMSGLELLERIQKMLPTQDVPVVVLTGLSDRVLKREALDRGAADLLHKPVDPEDLLARLRNVLRLKSHQDQLKSLNDLLEREVQDRTEELFHWRLEIIWRLAKTAEYRDEATGNHVIRVGCFSRVLAETLEMNRHFVETIFVAAPLHDIGKIGIPDSILLKKGPLGPGQWARMKQHCVIGAGILQDDCKVREAYIEWRGANSRSEIDGFDNPVLEMAATIALTHHEKWDGSGYPRGLAGEEIPLESRIVAIADVFDALSFKRPYRDPVPEEKVLGIIRDAAGSHFDPKVCQAFVKALPEIRSIRERLVDGGELSADSEEQWNGKGVGC